MEKKDQLSQALAYHKNPKPGKIRTEIKKIRQSSDLLLAYTPGVAEPCLAIHENPQSAYDYTSKGNSVAIISNGTAVLGLGDIGALASKPVMEGKALLLKYLAGVDATDIELNSKNEDEIINTIEKIAITFGGINLEDVAAPDCFNISKKLTESLDIPFFHDDQNGTAVVVAAAIQNALFLNKKDISKVKIVVSGAGAAALTCVDFLIDLGAKIENFYIFDSKGLIQENRSNLETSKKKYAQKNEAISIKEALIGADIFIGLSKGEILVGEDISQMNEVPIILAMANPVPEILPSLVKKARPDAITGSGRSDFANQVNNVLCFPFLFRGSLDCQAKKMTKNMQLACCEAIKNVARESKKFGTEYIIPDAFSPILIYKAALAVAQAAIKDGVAQKNLPENYLNFLDEMLYGSTITAKGVPTTDNQDLKDILAEHGITGKLDKTLEIMSYDEILKNAPITACEIITHTYEIGFKNNSNLQCTDLVKQIKEIGSENFIGLVYENKLYFNQGQRIWFANKLCR